MQSNPKCIQCGDEYLCIFGEHHCLNCAKERLGIPTLRSKDREIKALKARIKELEERNATSTS